MVPSIINLATSYLAAHTLECVTLVCSVSALIISWRSFHLSKTIARNSIAPEITIDIPSPSETSMNANLLQLMQGFRTIIITTLRNTGKGSAHDLQITVDFPDEKRSWKHATAPYADRILTITPNESHDLNLKCDYRVKMSPVVGAAESNERDPDDCLSSEQIVDPKLIRVTIRYRDTVSTWYELRAEYLVFETPGRGAYSGMPNGITLKKPPHVRTISALERNCRRAIQGLRKH